MRATIEREIAAVHMLARRLGLGTVDPVLLKAGHHSIFRVAPLRTVARVQSALPADTALNTAKLELAVARHLTAIGAPVIAPSASAIAGPHVVDRCTTTLWSYVDQTAEPKHGGAQAAASALRSVHAALASFDGLLPSFTVSLDSCRELLANPRELSELAEEDRSFLAARFLTLGSELEAHTLAPVPLHGDAHPGNIFWTDSGPIWGDLEAVCTGPIEWDLSALPPAMQAFFPEADKHLIDLFTDLRSACVAVWCWAEPARSAEVRSAAAYHLDRLRKRFPDR